VLVAYDEIGGYGHPDHVQAHRVAMYGYLLAGVPGYRPDLGEPWTVDRVVWSTMSATRMNTMIAALRESGDTETFAGWEGAEDAPMMSRDEDIAVAVDGTAYVAQKLDAMRAHATQILPDGTFFAGGKMSVDSMWSSEFYRFAAGTPFPGSADGTDGPAWADDLFAGLG
jgi:N-acetyl-1-D-myo-inositol-2-amino-2-deoxy-alpha-D-glucopyranoside deacetylase